MKQLWISIWATILMSMVGSKAYAYDIAVKNADGVTIYYNYINDATELEVTYSHYVGVINIPETVTYMNRTRSVTSIGNEAFNSCSELTSVTIPNSVTSIGNEAFYYCYGLTSVTIPNSVTSIGNEAFYNCYGLTSVTIGNSVISIGDQAFYGCGRLTSVTIPNSVTSIGNEAFYNCSGLTSVTIGNSVTSIGNEAFYGCSGLTSVTIGNSVTSIGDYAFRDCRGLTSVTIPNSVTSIGNAAFYGCSGLTSVTIPNSVTSISNGVFYDCSGLTSVTIPNSVTSIGIEAFNGCSGLTSVTIPNSVTSISEHAFNGCSGLTSVTIGNSVTSIGNAAFQNCNIPTIVSLIENLFPIYTSTFSLNTFKNATLYVPVGAIEKYKTTGGWKEFLFIEEGTGGTTPPTPQKCEKPTISYQNGKLTFSCETDGAVCHSTITNTDIKSYSDDEVELNVTYNISVYATKLGYENSETATATLCWIDVEPKTEGIENGVAQVRANAVMIQVNDGVVSVSGVDDGTNIAVYAVDGRMAGATTSSSNQATVITSLRKGEMAIVKIGDNSVKVIMQ